MKLFIAFVGRADPLVELYEGLGPIDFILRNMAVPGSDHLVLPVPGDVVRVRMLPGPDIRNFRCVGRRFDFSGEEEHPVLTIELDMPVVDPSAV